MIISTAALAIITGTRAAFISPDIITRVDSQLSQDRKLVTTAGHQNTGLNIALSHDEQSLRMYHDRFGWHGLLGLAAC